MACIQLRSHRSPRATNLARLGVPPQCLLKEVSAQPSGTISENAGSAFAASARCRLPCVVVPSGRSNRGHPRTVR